MKVARAEHIAVTHITHLVDFTSIMAVFLSQCSDELVRRSSE
jgi:hypothetical protein